MSVDPRLNWVLAHRGHLRMLLDVVLLGGLYLLSEKFIKLWGPPTQRGFFCDDESLMYPYKENTVSVTMLFWLSLYMPLATLAISESYRCWKRGGGASRWEQYWPLYNTMRWFIFGHVTERFLKNTGKQAIGRLRPHFFEICRPQLEDGSFCTDVGSLNSHVYHTVYTCHPELTGATEKMLHDVHVSFPSGHTSMFFYGFIFLALHLQRIRWPSPSTMLRPLCQLMLVGFATFVGLSRVMDYKHHWSDVAAGSLLGASIALAVVRGAEQEQRLYLHATVNAAAKCPVPTPAAAAVAKTDEELATGVEQLPHDLCCVVTCHSSN